MNISRDFPSNISIGECAVSRVFTDFEFPSSAVETSAEIDFLSPAAELLEFPVPTISLCRRVNVLAKDHRTSGRHLIKALVKRQPTFSRNYEYAYFLKRIISKSGNGGDTTWAAVVLKSLRGRYRAESSVHRSPFDIEWESIDKVVTVRVCAWQNRTLQEKGTLFQQISALQYIGDSNPLLDGCSEVWKDEKRVYIVAPYRPGNSIMEAPVDRSTALWHDRGIIQPDENEARGLFKQLCQGLLDLQQKGLYHGNISPETILKTENKSIIVSDLGMSARVPFSDPFNPGAVMPQGTCRRLVRVNSTRGDARFQAPEVAPGRAFDAFASDVWSTGIVLFVLLTGIVPFQRPENRDRVFKLVSTGHLQDVLACWDIDISRELCDLLQNMLTTRPSDRLTVSEIMEHPWVLDEAFQLSIVQGYSTAIQGGKLPSSSLSGKTTQFRKDTANPTDIQGCELPSSCMSGKEALVRKDTPKPNGFSNKAMCHPMRTHGSIHFSNVKVVPEGRMAPLHQDADQNCAGVVLEPKRSPGIKRHSSLLHKLLKSSRKKL